MPRRLIYLWNAFEEFSWGLKANGMGPTMADWQDVENFCVVQALVFAPWEKSVLVKLANIRASVHANQRQAKERANR